jgi:hypothetical protein
MILTVGLVVIACVVLAALAIEWAIAKKRVQDELDMQWAREQIRHFRQIRSLHPEVQRRVRAIYSWLISPESDPNYRAPRKSS